MKETFFSKALEANLAETRYKDIVIPNHHQDFINLSIDYFGINKRANECIVEFHHPLSNHQFVVEEIRHILLTDFWFYSQQQNIKNPFNIPLTLYQELLKKLQHPLARITINSLAEFINKAQTSGNNNLAIQQAIDILSGAFSLQKEAYMRSAVKLFKNLSATAQIKEYSDTLLKLAHNIVNSTFITWQSTLNINIFLNQRQQLPASIKAKLEEQLGEFYFNQLHNQLNTANTWEAITTQPLFNDIAEYITSQINIIPRFVNKFYFTFFLLHIRELNEQQERLIWNLNKMLRQALDETSSEELPHFIDQIFNYSEFLRQDHMSSVLDYMLTLGKKIIDRDQSEDKQLINYFEKKLIAFGFETPGKVFVNEAWQLHVNQNHIKNIRVWLELIEYSQSVMEKLLSALIVNLRLGGIFISDTDLFQREITKILNSDIAPYYKKVKQLTRIFPVYFNEIGAEGEIRKVTTTMDEICQRKDRLIHFLRKQVHTESNNTLIELTQKIFRFWCEGDLATLKEDLPADVYHSINKEDHWFKNIHSMAQTMCLSTQGDYQSLLELSDETYIKLLEQFPEQNNHDKERLRDIHNLYAYLKEKYSFETVNIIALLKRFPFINEKAINSFDQALQNNDFEASLRQIYHFMTTLKKIIFNPEPSNSWENIYHKRHIAIGIPSMYGVYRENKFEALGLTFRLEKVATRLMEKVVQNINLEYISAKTLHRIHTILEYFREGLELDGIYNQSFSSNLQMLRYSLTSQSFSFDQYINIFRFLADDIKRTINKYFLKSYEYPLKIIIPQLFHNNNPSINDQEAHKIHTLKSEIFYRTVITEAFLVQPLDNFVSKILTSLQNMADRFPANLIADIMSYNSDLTISPLYRPTIEIDNQIFLGSKAYHLKNLYLNKFPIPPGFVVTTEVFRRRRAINQHPEIAREINDRIRFHLAELEHQCHREIGNPKNPLLLSIRSGTAISMPGAMDTLLNVGMNDTFTEALCKTPRYAWTSWDSYRRLIQSWGMGHGIERDEFDQVMTHFKKNNNILLKADFSPSVMRQIAYAYKDILKHHGVIFEEDLFIQIRKAISLVFDSWASDRARVYREHLQIANEWGTAVVVQQMIMGNLHQNSGTGVVFTQNPLRERPGVHLYGDFTLCSQGEDIVSGLVKPMPVGETQRQQIKSKMPSLQTQFPDLYRKIHHLASDLTENHGYSPQEIEFTFESEHPNDLYILQIRDQDIRKDKSINVFSTELHQMKLAGRGIGIGGGAMNGLLAFDMEDLITLAQQHPQQQRILVRPDTVPDDIAMVFECNGLLTARGGATSHAAVTAVRLGKTCIVNCTNLLVNEHEKSCIINGITFKTGSFIAIDGHTGNIFRGHYPVEKSAITKVI